MSAGPHGALQVEAPDCSLPASRQQESVWPDSISAPLAGATRRAHTGFALARAEHSSSSLCCSTNVGERVMAVGKGRRWGIGLASAPPSSRWRHAAARQQRLLRTAPGMAWQRRITRLSGSVSSSRAAGRQHAEPNCHSGAVTAAWAGRKREDLPTCRGKQKCKHLADPLLT